MKHGENALAGASGEHVSVRGFGAQASCLLDLIVTNVEAGKMPGLKFTDVKRVVMLAVTFNER